MTARLALGPRAAHLTDYHDPDFVNSQAVYARALCQTLAYPMIQVAVADMFDDMEGNNFIDLSISKYLINNN